MSTKERLDVALVARGLAETRAKAQASIMSGIVYVNGQKVDKAGTPVAADAVLEVRGHTLRYVSRGGLKLEKAMEAFPICLFYTSGARDTRLAHAAAAAARTARRGEVRRRLLRRRARAAGEWDAAAGRLAQGSRPDAAR